MLCCTGIFQGEAEQAVLVQMMVGDIINVQFLEVLTATLFLHFHLKTVLECK